MAKCFTLLDAGNLVLDKCPRDVDIDSTLEQAGFVTAGQRKVFCQSLADAIGSRPCNISVRKIPSAASTTLRQVRQAIFDNAIKEELG